VRPIAVNRLVSRLLLNGAFAAATAVASAGNIAGVAPNSPRARQITFYVSQSLGSGSTSRLLTGIRIEEVGRMPSGPRQAEVGPSQQRELVSLQLMPRSDAGISFGRRLTWNFARETLEPHATSPSAPLALAVDSIKLPGPEPSPGEPQVSARIREKMAIEGGSRVGAIEIRSIAPSQLGIQSAAHDQSIVEFPRMHRAEEPHAGVRP
jgi:hypothetical protein